MTTYNSHLRPSPDWPNPICTDCDRTVLVTYKGQCLGCQPENGGVKPMATIGHGRRTLTSREVGVR